MLQFKCYEGKNIKFASLLVFNTLKPTKFKTYLFDTTLTHQI